ncbi:hypothetical protein EON64_02940 [archaeon]|nr:MAG: hypothetical protein EON64_02940 [archaeon]
MQQVEKQYEETKAEHASMETELQKASTQYDSFERKEVKLQEDLKHSRATVKKHQAALAKEEKKVEESADSIASITTQITKSESLIEDFNRKKLVAEEELQEQMKKVSSATQHVKVELEHKQRLLGDAEKQAGSLFTDHELLQGSIRLIKERAAKAEEEVSELTEKIEAVQSEIRELTTQLIDLDSVQRKEKLIQLGDLENKKQSLQQEEQEIKDQISSLMQQIEENKETLSRSKNSASADKTIQAILQASKLGSLSSVNIVGRLGDLACIGSKYDVAINTACKYLNHIVVQRTEDAQAIISYLRDNNLGRACFILLEQMGEFAQKMNMPFAVPNNTVQRLFDLLEDVHSEEVRAAFYMALSNTLVAADLDSAVAVAYNSRTAYRVVTLQGQLIDTSGAMSGGGNEVKKGLLKLTIESSSNKSSKNKSVAAACTKTRDSHVVSEDVIRQQEQQLHGLQAGLNQIHGKISVTDMDIKKLQASIKQLDRDTEKMQVAIGHKQEKLREQQTRIASLQTESTMTKEEERELAKLTKQLEQLEQQIAVSSPNLKTLQMEVNSLQRNIFAFGGPEISKLNDKIESCAAQIDSLTNSLTTKKVELASLQKGVDKANASMEKIKSDIDKCAKKLGMLFLYGNPLGV